MLCEVPNYVKLTPVLARFGRIYDIPISGSLHIIPVVWPCRRLFDSRSRSFLKHFPLHFHVNFHIDVSSIDICVPQPVSYHVDVVSSPQQMHGRCMSYRMGGNGFGSEGRALC